jgi:hypothetical protein
MKMKKWKRRKKYQDSNNSDFDYLKIIILRNHDYIDLEWKKFQQENGNMDKVISINLFFFQ